jgi:hypothetical protein
MMCRLVALGLVLLAVSVSASARAQLELSMRVSAREVTVGEVIQVQLDALSSDDNAPGSPEIVVPAGFDVRGPSVSTRQQVSISNFSMVTQKGISATWLLTPSRPGLYTLGPASVMLGGQQQLAQTTQVRVLPPGQKANPRVLQRRRSPFDPFDAFGQNDSFDDIFERLRRSSAPQLPEAPPELAVDRAPDHLAFLRARLDRKEAVVGEQVTLSIYAYGGQGLFEESAAREPSHPEFLAQRLVEGGSQPVYQIDIGGNPWVVVKVREIALFPLRPGRLEVGAFEFGFLGRRYGARTGEGLRRSTPPLFVNVSEPPVLGRPPGFSGDVGRFRLEARVDPREIPAGGAISVVATVRGTGRLPGRLHLPEQSGLEWVEPTLRDDATVTGNRVGGSRSFSYVVRMLEPGTVELGQLSLPYYDPVSRRYRAATADLGEVLVAPAPAGNAPPPQAAGSGPRLGKLYEFRNALPPVAPSRYLADARWFWLLVGGAPALALLLVVARAGYRRHGARPSGAVRARLQGRSARRRRDGVYGRW